jgi:hypothetical protein
MKKEYSSRSVFVGPRRLFSSLPCSVFLALFCCATLSNANASVETSAPAQPQVSAILLPVTGDSRSSQLAVSWRGEAGVQLRVSLVAPGQPKTVLVEDRPLEAGVSLYSLPLNRSADGRLDLEVLAANGAVLESRRYPIGALFGSSDGAAWEPNFFGPGLDNNVIAAVVWDDGNGPALYVGGLFFSAGKYAANGIARWDGSEWSALDGPAGTGVNGSVFSLTVYDGALIAGGLFTQAGGVTSNNIARWNGREWSALGTGTSGQLPGVFSLTVFHGTLIAAGGFTEAGGVTVNGIAAWDGSEWSSLDSGVESGTVFSLSVYDDALIAGGNFTQIGGVNANLIARWDGRGWSPLGSGLGEGEFAASVNALTVYDGALIAGGRFFLAGGMVVNNVARWDGGSWKPVGLGVSGGTVYALSVFDGALFAGGAFTVAGTIPVHNIARWDGSAWSSLAGSADSVIDGVDSQVRALTTFDDTLMVGGVFTRAAGRPVNRIARWDGRRWSPLGSSGAGLNGDLFAVTVYNNALIVGGRFTQAGATIANHIASWDGSEWKSLDGPSGTGLNDIVMALTVYGGQLIAGGFFTEAGGVSVNRIASWNGSFWSPLDKGTNDTVRALTVYGGELIAGGQFTQAGGGNASRIARWDGRRWAPLGSGISGDHIIPIYALTVYNGALIAAGEFLQAGGKTKNNIASWDGREWSPLSGPTKAGVNGRVQALTVFDGTLVAGGAFTQAGGIPANWIARWDGSNWSPLGSEVSGGCCDPLIRSLTVFDNALIAGGVFTDAGTETVNFIARWDGRAWSALAGPSGTGMSGASETGGGGAATSVQALTTFDADGLGPAPEKLVAAGNFSLTGGVANWGVALYGPTPKQTPR